MISLLKAGLSDMRRPLGAFLFAGPTGVGKTHVAQLLAAYLFGSRERVIRLNMADFQTPDDALRVFGNPDAYAQSSRRGLLTSRLLGHPFAVLLLDEFEKGSDLLLDRFFQLIDEGSFTNGAGEAVSCRSSILIATTNAGAEVYRQPALGFRSERALGDLDRELDARLFARFRHEFLNRFDQIVHFHPLDRAAIRQVALREIEALQERAGIRFQSLSLEVDDAVLDWLAVHGYDMRFGARHLKRVIERSVTTALAEALVGEPVAPGSVLAVSVRGERVTAALAPPRPPRAEPGPARAAAPRAPRARKLDRGKLLGDAQQLLARAPALADRLEADRARGREILAEINREGFWDDPATAQGQVAAYRSLELLDRHGARAAAALAELADLAAQTDRDRAALAALARALEDASWSLGEWERRQLEAGPSSAWLYLQTADPVTPAADFLEELVRMELAWCRRLQLDAELVAHGARGKHLARAALHASGPGALAYLQMEHGTHRAQRSPGPDARVRVHLVPERFDAPPLAVTALRAGPALLGLAPRCAGRLERPGAGERIELVGSEHAILGALLRDLGRYLASAPDASAPVRLYGYDGAAARDPRTGAAIASPRDVARGRLEALLEPYRRLATPASG
jgi:ATP-dependent Clp protease ATP-binding subunit ClpC